MQVAQSWRWISRMHRGFDCLPLWFLLGKKTFHIDLPGAVSWRKGTKLAKRTRTPNLRTTSVSYITSSTSWHTDVTEGNIFWKTVATLASQCSQNDSNAWFSKRSVTFGRFDLGVWVAKLHRSLLRGPSSRFTSHKFACKFGIYGCLDVCMYVGMYVGGLCVYECMNV